MRGELDQATTVLNNLAKQARKAAPFDGPCRYLISLDYDGTLRRASSPHISPVFVRLMADLRHRGIRWGINTGRKLHELIAEIDPPLHHLPDFICTCERYVYMADEQGILRPAEQNNQQCTVDNEALSQRYQSAVISGFERMRQLYPQVPWDYCKGEPFSICAPSEQELGLLIPYLTELVDGFEGLCIQRAGRYMRFSDKRYNKATALRCVAKAWGVVEARLVLLGDGHNDLCAFKTLPKAFCASPQIAHPDVLSYLQSIGGHQSEDGVNEAIIHWHRKTHH